MNGENRDISTVQLQVLKEWKPNCIRHFPTTLQDQHQKVHYDAPHSMIHRLTRTHVRKHLAPNGALRQINIWQQRLRTEKFRKPRAL